MQTDCRNKLDIIMKTLMIGLHKFLTRFSGRRRLFQVKHERKRRNNIKSQKQNIHKLTTSCRYSPTLSFIIILLVCAICDVTEACRTRTFIRHRQQPTTTSPRPKIQHQIHKCHEDYAKWYCLNDATCFEVRIGDEVIYNCECADGFFGPRCDYKNPDGSYLNLSARSRIIIIEKAGIAGGTLAICLILICIVGIIIWMRSGQSKKYEFEVESQVGNHQRETSFKSSQNCKISDRFSIAITRYHNG